MFQYLERGNLLYHQKRYQEAEKEYKKILAIDPKNPFGLAMLAQCYLEMDQKTQALDYAKNAMQYGSESPTIYYILAKCLFYNKRIEQALSIIQSGQQIDPANSDFFLLKSQIAFYQENWNIALSEAEHGLELDPEDVSLINLRAQALVKLNRTQEASETMDYALNRAPQSSFSHANKGWVAVENSQYESAILHFKEALRLDASNQYAKTGLREAIKAKNFLYRIVLKYFLWMSKLQEKYRWGFVIGIYLLYRLAFFLAEMSDLMALIMMPLIIAYILFAFSSWIAMPISNLFLRLHPLGKYTLEEDEILASSLVGILGGTAIFSFALFFVLGGSIDLGSEDWEMKGYQSLFMLGIYLFLMMIPVGGLFYTEKGTLRRRNLTIYAITLAVVGSFAILTNLSLLFTLFFLGILFYGFVANYFYAQESKEI